MYVAGMIQAKPNKFRYDKNKETWNLLLKRCTTFRSSNQG